MKGMARNECRISNHLCHSHTIQRSTEMLFTNDARFPSTVLACLPWSFGSCVVWDVLRPSHCFLHMLYASFPWFCLQLDFYAYHMQKFPLTRPLHAHNSASPDPGRQVLLWAVHWSCARVIFFSWRNITDFRCFPWQWKRKKQATKTSHWNCVLDKVAGNKSVFLVSGVRLAPGFCPTRWKEPGDQDGSRLGDLRG